LPENGHKNVVVVQDKLIRFENLSISGSRPRGFMTNRDRRNAIVVELVVHPILSQNNSSIIKYMHDY
jgi:hypothetical protein